MIWIIAPGRAASSGGVPQSFHSQLGSCRQSPREGPGSARLRQSLASTTHDRHLLNGTVFVLVTSTNYNYTFPGLFLLQIIILIKQQHSPSAQFTGMVTRHLCTKAEAQALRAFLFGGPERTENEVEAFVSTIENDQSVSTERVAKLMRVVHLSQAIDAYDVSRDCQLRHTSVCKRYSSREYLTSVLGSRCHH